jgi:hypothetical protein
VRPLSSGLDVSTIRPCKNGNISTWMIWSHACQVSALGFTRYILHFEEEEELKLQRLQSSHSITVGGINIYWRSDHHHYDDDSSGNVNFSHREKVCISKLSNNSVGTGNKYFNCSL